MTSKNWLLIFFGKTRSENKIMFFVEDLDEKKLQQQRQTLETVKDYSCEAKKHWTYFEKLHFSFFSSGFHFSFVVTSFPFFLSQSSDPSLPSQVW